MCARKRIMDQFKYIHSKKIIKSFNFSACFLSFSSLALPPEGFSSTRHYSPPLSTASCSLSHSRSWQDSASSWSVLGTALSSWFPPWLLSFFLDLIWRTLQRYWIPLDKSFLKFTPSVYSSNVSIFIGICSVQASLGIFWPNYAWFFNLNTPCLKMLWYFLGKTSLLYEKPCQHFLGTWNYPFSWCFQGWIWEGLSGSCSPLSFRDQY